MTVGSKYGQYLFREPIIKNPRADVLAPMIAIVNVKQWQGAKLSFRISTITQPFVMEIKAHVHDYDAYMCFFGGNPLNFAEFEAEIELCLGEEGEKQIITESTAVYLPKGLYHCPLIYRRVNKPVLFLQIFPESENARN